MCSNVIVKKNKFVRKTPDTRLLNILWLQALTLMPAPVQLRSFAASDQKTLREVMNPALKDDRYNLSEKPHYDCGLEHHEFHFQPATFQRYYTENVHCFVSV